MTVEVVAGTAGLSGVLSVVHARAVEVERLHFDTRGARAVVRMVVCLDLEAAHRLGRQLERRADVTRVQVGDRPQPDRHEQDPGTVG
ncbi:MAG: hypothetical protein LH469_13870 [Frankiaceae bacterium]|nr:hypothetical protein [Frankiaceae bacterium]